MKNLTLFTILILIGSVIGSKHESQEKWSGLCEEGLKQSPINIKLKDV